ncbi:DNA methyltransferase [Rhodanobacter sp. C06]|uniref:DNA adenine methylase n=1 Tax=Rhodanobacter sp. C06 TaxID=1945854 RepID=UPI0009848CB4|nr:DNA adenine methylase [Rhodanobacter sp. C06]OOG51421.1 DNA methyltransferase [Rhodanobacter sp. C06]
MYSNKLYTPLRYPGGKARFAPFVAGVLETNGLEGGHYLEPYAGGAGVALELLFHSRVEHIHINDADPAVYSFWIAATQFTNELIELVRDTPVTMNEWYRWRSIMLGQEDAGPVYRGFATLFMNRTNRSGILKGGVIGGKQQAGAYSLDVRFKREALEERLSRIGRFSKQITVYRDDALALLKTCHKFMPRKSLVYLDPPYYVKGQGLYRNFYDHDDHVSVARFLQSARFTRPWIVSYDNVKEIRQMYKGVSTLSYDLNYTAQRRYHGSEVMFFSDRLHVPSRLTRGTKAA